MAQNMAGVALMKNLSFLQQQQSRTHGTKNLQIFQHSPNRKTLHGKISFSYTYKYCKVPVLYYSITNLFNVKLDKHAFTPHYLLSEKNKRMVEGEVKLCFCLTVSFHAATQINAPLSYKVHTVEFSK